MRFRGSIRCSLRASRAISSGVRRRLMTSFGSDGCVALSKAGCASIGRFNCANSWPTSSATALGSGACRAVFFSSIAATSADDSESDPSDGRRPLLLCDRSEPERSDASSWCAAAAAADGAWPPDPYLRGEASS